KDIDSLKENNVEKVGAFSKNIINRMGAFPSVPNRNSGAIQDQKAKIAKEKTPSKDSITDIDGLLDRLEEWQSQQVVKNAKNSVSGILSTVGAKRDELSSRYKFYNSHILSLHQKY